MNILKKIHNRTATLADQDEALKEPRTAYWFAKKVPGADIEKCQEVACRDPQYAFYFARYIDGANIEKCQEVVCRDSGWAYLFAREVIGADIRRCIKTCRGTIWETDLNQYMMEKALL